MRLVIFSSKAQLVVVTYPDSQKIGIWTKEQGYLQLLRDQPKLDYWDGE